MQAHRDDWLSGTHWSPRHATSKQTQGDTRASMSEFEGTDAEASILDSGVYSYDEADHDFFTPSSSYLISGSIPSHRAAAEANEAIQYYLNDPLLDHTNPTIDFSLQQHPANIQPLDQDDHVWDLRLRDELRDAGRSGRAAAAMPTHEMAAAVVAPQRWEYTPGYGHATLRPAQSQSLNGLIPQDNEATDQRRWLDPRGMYAGWSMGQGQNRIEEGHHSFGTPKAQPHPSLIQYSRPQLEMERPRRPVPKDQKVVVHQAQAHHSRVPTSQGEDDHRSDMLIQPERTVPEDKRSHCQYCDRSYAKIAGLRRHIGQKHERSAKRYKCSKCEHEDFWVKKIARHEETHDEAKKRYKCDRCEKGFSRKDNLQKHKRNYHR